MHAGHERQPVINIAITQVCYTTKNKIKKTQEIMCKVNSHQNVSINTTARAFPMPKSVVVNL